MREIQQWRHSSSTLNKITVHQYTFTSFLSGYHDSRIKSYDRQGLQINVLALSFLIFGGKVIYSGSSCSTTKCNFHANRIMEIFTNVTSSKSSIMRNTPSNVSCLSSYVRPAKAEKPPRMPIIFTPMTLDILS